VVKAGDKKVNLFDNLGEYFSLSGKYWSWFFVILLLVVISSLTLVGESYLFSQVLDKGAGFIAGTIQKDAFIEILIGIGTAFAGVVIVRSISNWGRFFFINRLDAKLIFDLKNKFFVHILGLSHKFHSTHRTGSLIAKMTRGARSIEGITDFFVFSTIPLVIQLFVACVSLLYFDVFSVITIIGIMIVFLAFVMLLTKLQQKPKILSNEADDAEKAFIGDIFTNIDTIKYFGKERQTGSLFGNLSQHSSKMLVTSWDYESFVEIGQSLIMGVGVAFLLYFPLVKFLDGGLSIGSLAFIYTVYLNIGYPMFGFIFGIRRFYEAMADFQSLIDYDKIKNDVPDVKGAKELHISEGKIEFNNVSFMYQKKEVIKEFSLEIKPKEKVALVGYSGSGKTTLVKLLYRFYDVGGGEILIDGKNISQVKQESLRSELSIVPQEGILFNDTILNNVAFANPNAKREDVMNALKSAQLYDFVMSSPEKENTFVGERGIKLSGGERQRLSIARAILANKKVLVLDEATSSLDSITESQIQNALSTLMKGRTTIIIAHRLSTIMSADKIVVINRGKIAQIGKHSELINQKGIYKRLWNMQKGGYIRV